MTRPTYCCGACPELARGGYDCTCRGNPRCEKSTENNKRTRMYQLLLGIAAGGVIVYLLLLLGGRND